MISIYTIYKYTNIINGKVYIGQTSRTLEERAQSNGRNYRECPRFYNAIRKYSWESFIPEILEVVDTVEEANKRECFYISKYDSTNPEKGYNLLSGGNCAPIPDEAKQKISEAAKKRYEDKTKNPMYGKKHSDETISKMRECKLGELNPMFGRSWTDEQRRCCSTKGKHLNLSEEQRDILREKARKLGKEVGNKPVKCLEDNLCFESISKAAAAYGVTKSTLNGHLKGRQHTCAGRHFEYI